MIITNRSTLGTIRGAIAAGIAIAAAASFTSTPTAWADPDPHIPNGAAGWCPGGQQSDNCLGESYPDGTFYRQERWLIASQPFRGPQWLPAAYCTAWINGQMQGGQSGCGGGPAILNF